jgi:hypothetical protein
MKPAGCIEEEEIKAVMATETQLSEVWRVEREQRLNVCKPKLFSNRLLVMTQELK